MQVAMGPVQIQKLLVTCMTHFTLKNDTLRLSFVLNRDNTSPRFKRTCPGVLIVPVVTSAIDVSYLHQVTPPIFLCNHQDRITDRKEYRLFMTMNQV